MNFIIFMKYGVHAKEEVHSIIKRKQEEIEKNGYCFWGYGGVLLHPLNQVQPFCENKDVYLLLSSTNSKHVSNSNRQKFYSTDKFNYEEIPKNINVYGSKYALVLESLEKFGKDINISDYEVAIGNSEGKNLIDYLVFRVDKACARYKKGTKEKMVHIDYIAKLKSPYAVFVKDGE